MKTVADTLGVTRSNLVEQLRGSAKPRRRYRRQGDDELLAAIRQITGVAPPLWTVDGLGRLSGGFGFWGKLPLIVDGRFVSDR